MSVRHARARPCTPVHARACPGMPEHARACPSTPGHAGASLNAGSPFPNGNRLQVHSTEGPPPPGPSPISLRLTRSSPVPRAIVGKLGAVARKDFTKLIFANQIWSEVCFNFEKCPDARHMYCTKIIIPPSDDHRTKNKVNSNKNENRNILE